MKNNLLSGRLFMYAVVVLLFAVVALYGNNLDKAAIQFSKDEMCNKSKIMGRDTIKLHIGSKVFVAVLEDNSSAIALKELLSKGNVKVEMSDYAHMEKVGILGVKLPRNDEWIQTDSGDLILYQGHYMVIYYDHNSYSLTRLGKIINVTQNELKNALGKGNVTVVLSLE